MKNSKCLSLHLKNKTTIRLLILSLLLSFIVTSTASCGFQLRGAVRLPSSMKIIHIRDSQPGSIIYLHLREALMDKDIIVSDSPDTYQAKDEKPQAVTSILYLTNETFERRLLSSGSSTQVKEYQLNYSITFGLDSTDNKPLLTSQSIYIAREQRFDETQVLAKISELEQLKLEMMQDAVRQMMRRFETVNN